MSPTGCLSIMRLLILLVLLSTAADGGMVIVVAGGGVASVRVLVMVMLSSITGRFGTLAMVMVMVGRG